MRRRANLVGEHSPAARRARLAHAVQRFCSRRCPVSPPPLLALHSTRFCSRCTNWCEQLRARRGRSRAAQTRRFARPWRRWRCETIAKRLRRQRRRERRRVNTTLLSLLTSRAVEWEAIALDRQAEQRRAREAARPPAPPWFILAFIGVASLNTVFTFDPELVRAAGKVRFVWNVHSPTNVGTNVCTR